MRNEKTNQQPKNGRALWKLVIAGIAVFTVAAIVLSLIFSSIGYRGTVRQMTKAFKSGDVDRLYSLTWFPDGDYEAEDGEDVKAFLAAAVDSMSATFRDAFGGKRYHLSSEITKKTPMRKSWIDEANNDLRLNTEDDSIKIDNALVLEVTFNARRGGKTAQWSTEFSLVKTSGKWYLSYPNEF